MARLVKHEAKPPEHRGTVGGLTFEMEDAHPAAAHRSGRPCHA